MRKIRLTWDQARNLLATGMCIEVKYMDMSNRFQYKNGNFYRDVYKNGFTERRLPNYQDDLFMVTK